MLAHNFKLSERIRIQSLQCRGAVASFFSVSLPLDKPAIDLRFLGWEVIYAGNDVEFLQRRRAAAGPLNRARDWRIFIQRPMCSNLVVIASIGSQDSAQMRLAQDDEMVNTLAPDRSDRPFGKAILPRRGWCRRLVPDAHGAQSACDDGTIDPITVPNHVARSLVPRERFRYLTRNPFGVRICCDADSN